MSAAETKEAINTIVKKTPVARLNYVLRLLQLIDTFWKAKDTTDNDEMAARIALTHFALDLEKDDLKRVCSLASALQWKERRMAA